MADYYMPTVVDPLIPLAAMLQIERLFLAQVFNEEVVDEAAHYFSEDGACEQVFLDAEAVRSAVDAGSAEGSSLMRKLFDEYGAAILAGDAIELDDGGDLSAEVLQDIVRRSPDLDHLTVTMAFTCSKMRSDGFGGLAMLITAETIRSESTHTVFERFYTEAAANGEIGHGNS